MERKFAYNYIQGPASQQGFNRYAYCFYNPLRYTDHEHMTTFALINMNGRMNDTMMSSFLSVDEYVQDLTCTQRWVKKYSLNEKKMYFCRLKNK